VPDQTVAQSLRDRDVSARAEKLAKAIDNAFRFARTCPSVGMMKHIIAQEMYALREAAPPSDTTREPGDAEWELAKEFVEFYCGGSETVTRDLHSRVVTHTQREVALAVEQAHKIVDKAFEQSWVVQDCLVAIDAIAGPDAQAARAAHDREIRRKALEELETVIKKHVASCESMRDTFRRVGPEDDKWFYMGMVAGLERALEVMHMFQSVIPRALQPAEGDRT